MGQNSLLAKCIVVAPQNRCRTNVTKTECECRQSLTHLLTRKNNVVQKKMFFDNLNLTSWQTVQSSNLLGGKYILLAIFSSLLDKQLVQTKALSWENPIFCRFQYTTDLLNSLSLYYSLFTIHFQHHCFLLFKKPSLFHSLLGQILHLIISYHKHTPYILKTLVGNLLRGRQASLFLCLTEWNHSI